LGYNALCLPGELVGAVADGKSPLGYNLLRLRWSTSTAVADGKSPLGYNRSGLQCSRSVAVADGKSPLGYNFTIREPAPARRQSAMPSGFSGGLMDSGDTVPAREK